MKNMNDENFVIENGVLEEYTGPGGDVVIPAGVTEIGEGASRGCTGLVSVIIPERVTEMGDDIFDGCGNLTIRTPAGSRAEQYAQKHDIPVVTE